VGGGGGGGGGGFFVWSFVVMFLSCRVLCCACRVVCVCDLFLFFTGQTDNDDLGGGDDDFDY